MNKNRPRYLKVVLFNNNLLEVGGSALQTQCFTVQDYHYHCYRERDKEGDPYGGILSEYLDFSILASDPYAIKYFYKCMEQKQPAPFSFIFNATFQKGTGRLYDFEDGLVTYGHVVDIEEMFDDDDQTGNEQLLIHVRLLVSNIIFIGNSSFLLLEITKD